jgi:Amt family ammonium transporter
MDVDVDGLVAVTSAAGSFSPSIALVLAAVAAVPSCFALVRRARTTRDDSLEVVAAHGVGGTGGAPLTGVFVSKALNGVAGGDTATQPNFTSVRAEA